MFWMSLLRNTSIDVFLFINLIHIYSRQPIMLLLSNSNLQLSCWELISVVLPLYFQNNWDVLSSTSSEKRKSSSVDNLHFLCLLHSQWNICSNWNCHCVVGYTCQLLVFIFGRHGHAHRLVVKGLSIIGLTKQDLKIEIRFKLTFWLKFDINML